MKKIMLLIIVCCYAHTTSAQILVALLFGDKLSSEKVEFGLNITPTLSTEKTGS